MYRLLMIVTVLSVVWGEVLAASALEGEVTYVYDGDTIVVLGIPEDINALASANHC